MPRALRLAMFGAILGAIALASSACGEGARADLGLHAWMRVDGAQYYRGAMPDGRGPSVASIELATNTMRAGELGKPVKGSLAPGANAVALMLGGDDGYWILPTDAPDVASPTYPSFHAALSFSRDLRGGDYTLVVRAVDADGQFGPANQDNVLNATAEGAPAGELVFALTWDTEADLDLHVVEPDGVEIFNRNINSYTKPAPGQPSDPGAVLRGGVLDFDSNANCVIDGVRQENIAWSAPPPSGHYIARVDTFSLCGEIDAHWTLRAYRAGDVIAEAHGASFEADTRPPHDRGAGVLAIELDLP
jgi:hypothetical protein